MGRPKLNKVQLNMSVDHDIFNHINREHKTTFVPKCIIVNNILKKYFKNKEGVTDLKPKLSKIQLNISVDKGVVDSISEEHRLTNTPKCVIVNKILKEFIKNKETKEGISEDMSNIV